MNIDDEVESLLYPLLAAVESPAAMERFLRELDLLPGGRVLDLLPPEITALADTLATVMTSVAAVADPSLGADERTAALITASGDLFETLDGLGNLDLGADPPWPFDQPDVLQGLAERASAYLLSEWLRDRHPSVFELLTAIDVLHDREGPVAIDPARLFAVVADPWPVVRDLVVQDPHRSLRLIRTRFARGRHLAPQPVLSLDEDLQPVWSQPGPDDPDGSGFRALLGAAAPVDVGVDVVFDDDVPALLATASLMSSSVALDLGEDVELEITAGLETVSLLLGVDGVTMGGTDTADELTLALRYRPPEPVSLVGSIPGTRLELAGAGLGLSLADLATVTPEVAATLELDGLRFVLAAGAQDAFIGSILGDDEYAVDLPLTARYSTAEGFTVDGSVGFEVAIATSARIGPVSFDELVIALGLGAASVELGVGATVSAQVGPFSAAVSGLGLEVVVREAGTGGVRLGPFEGALAVSPPTGVGLAIALGPVSGGGYLDIDHEAGRYEGVLDLRVVEVGISAVAIIETKLPDVDGWSAFLALYISIPSIQIGFGFALTGVGGVAGINRSIDTEALGTAVRSGALSTVLFPEDPIAEAPAIIDTFSAIFPAADDSYVFGPIIQIAWGTPSLIEGELGVVIQVPDPIVIAILGSVSMVLPTKELDLVAVNIDVAGVVDFGAGTIAVDASVHNSHVIGFALSGDVALRASLRGRPEFLLSMGGFHPDFDPPAGFPTLKRLSLGLNGGSMLEISFDCYLALTSNTVQFGAAFSISAEVSGFEIDGGTEFDAIVQFSPFKLRTSIGLHIAVTAVGVDLAGVWLSGSLEGPNPWHIVGNAEFKLGPIKESIRVDEKIGATQPEPAVAGSDLLAALAQHLDDDDAWSVIGSGGAEVVLAPVEATDALRTDPDGTVAVSQSLVPINVEIERFGQVEEPSHTYFEIVTGSGLSFDGLTTAWFAPAQYFDLKPKERLRSPSFDEHPAGVEFGGGVSFGEPRTGTLSHEMDYVDPYFEELAATGEGGASPAPGAMRPSYWLGDDARRAKRGLDLAPVASGAGPVSAQLEPKETVFAVRPSRFEVTDPSTGAPKTVPASFMTAYAAAEGSDVIAMVPAP